MAQGTPLIYSGDEFCNTRFGNNNPYCQDNETGWIKWNRNGSGEEIFSYIKDLIRLKKEHPILHCPNELKVLDYTGCGIDTDRTGSHLHMLLLFGFSADLNAIPGTGICQEMPLHTLRKFRKSECVWDPMHIICNIKEIIFPALSVSGIAATIHRSRMATVIIQFRPPRFRAMVGQIRIAASGIIQHFQFIRAMQDRMFFFQPD